MQRLPLFFPSGVAASSAEVLPEGAGALSGESGADYLTVREATISRTEADVTQREAAVTQREADVAQREAQMAEDEAVFEAKRQSLSDDNGDLAFESFDAAQRDALVDGLQAEIAGLRKHLNVQQAELDHTYSQLMALQLPRSPPSATSLVLHAEMTVLDAPVHKEDRRRLLDTSVDTGTAVPGSIYDLLARTPYFSVQKPGAGAGGRWALTLDLSRLERDFGGRGRDADVSGISPTNSPAQVNETGTPHACSPIILGVSHVQPPHITRRARIQRRPRIYLHCSLTRPPAAEPVRILQLRRLPRQVRRRLPRWTHKVQAHSPLARCSDAVYAPDQLHGLRLVLG